MLQQASTREEALGRARLRGPLPDLQVAEQDDSGGRGEHDPFSDWSQRQMPCLSQWHWDLWEEVSMVRMPSLPF